MAIDAEGPDFELGHRIQQLHAGAVVRVEANGDELAVKQRLQAPMQLTSRQQRLLDQVGPGEDVGVGTIELQQHGRSEVGHVGHVGAIEAKALDVRSRMSMRPSELPAAEFVHVELLEGLQDRFKIGR